MVLFWSLDRFSREGVLETLQYLQRLTAHGVDYRSFTEQYIDSLGIFRDAVIGILATIGKQERIRLSERVVAGLERARKQGRVGGRPAKNYEHDKDAKRIRQMREEGQSMQEIADELGRSKTNIHKLCNALGCASASPSSVPTMLV